MSSKIFILFALLVAVQSGVLPAPKRHRPTEEEVRLTVRNAIEVLGVDPKLEEDAILTVPELIKKYEYPVEDHAVTTADGYILHVHRIPHGKTNKDQERKGVVFLQHGIFCASADWVLAGPDKGLAYLLADQGYDVWLGNARGNRYSRQHTHLNPDKDSEYWRFSWHQIGYYDLPAMIDKALEVTQESQLFYAGHSQGTTSFFVMTSERPEYNKKIRAQFSMAPIAYMKHMTSPVVKFMSNFVDILNTVADLIGLDEFLPSSEFLTQIGSQFCGDDSVSQLLCTNALFLTCGFNQKEMNTTLLPVIMGHTPAGIATDQLVHYGQEVHALLNHFRQFDHGIVGNLKQYGSINPPDYDLSKVTAPVYLLYSHNDWLAAESDVLRLYDELSNAQGKFLMSDDSWNHLDYTYGIHAKEVAYNKIISLMARH